jgi:dUTP pyrophosphatase
MRKTPITLQQRGLKMITVYKPKILFEPKIAFPEQVPSYATKRSACFDIVSDSPTFTIEPGDRCLVSTGLYLQEPEHYEKIRTDAHALIANGRLNLVLNIRPRSSLAMKGIDVGAGEIDSDFLHPNEIKVLLINNSKVLFEVVTGNKIAQARWTITLQDTDLEIAEVVRTAGFGSTGV